jgi:hypothetical protein
MVIAWPTYANDSYMRWRLPAVSFLRVFLVALPFNFSTTVFDAIAPNVGNGGRFAALSLGFQAFLGERGGSSCVCVERGGGLKERLCPTSSLCECLVSCLISW